MGDSLELVGLDTSKRAGLYHAIQHYHEYQDLAKVSEKFVEWVKTDQFLLLQNLDTGKYHLRKCSKRGNDYYRKRTWRRYKKLYALNESMPVKRDRDFSSFAFATFTYRSSDIEGTMKNVSSDWNRYITALRKRHGNVSSIRCYECQARGIIHIHAIIVFHERKFKTFLHDKKRRFSIRDEIFLNKYDKQGNLLKEKLWPHGFTDFFALNSWKHSLNYISKYFMKDLELSTQKEIDSTALLWIYKKRTYAVSKRLEVLCITQTKKSGKFALLGIGICPEGVDLSLIAVHMVIQWKDCFDIYYEGAEQGAV